MPVEPPPTNWAFPDPRGADPNGLLAVGADLEPATLLAAYRNACFPMPVRGSQIGWWSPDPRGVVPLDGLRLTRSLRRSLRRYEIRVDTCFDQVVASCADPGRPHGWINDDIAAAYRILHTLGWAHSVETWDAEDEILAGGLYGVSIGGLFAGESMFHLRTDASKVALVALVDLLRTDGIAGRLLDVQWVTPHLATLGAVEVSMTQYLDLLEVALRVPQPPW